MWQLIITNCVKLLTPFSLLPQTHITPYYLSIFYSFFILIGSHIFNSVSTLLLTCISSLVVHSHLPGHTFVIKFIVVYQLFNKSYWFLSVYSQPPPQETEDPVSRIHERKKADAGRGFKETERFLYDYQMGLSELGYVKRKRNKKRSVNL